MADYEIRIDLDTVDFGSLCSDADLRREATRLLPKALTQIGEASAGQAWDELRKGFRRMPGFKDSNSSTDRRNFIRECGEKYQRTAGDDVKRKVVDHIVAQLKQRTEGQNMPITYNEMEMAVLRFLKQEYLTNGGSPQHMQDTGGTTKTLVMHNCGLNEIEYREIVGRFDHFGFIQRCAKDSPDERLNINDSILEAVRSLDGKPAVPQSSTIYNTMNIGTMNNSAIQQGSAGASQTLTITIQVREDIEKILAAVTVLVDQVPQSLIEVEGLKDEIEIIRSQLTKAEPKQSIIKKCMNEIKSGLEKVAGMTIVAASKAAILDVGQQIDMFLASWRS